MKKVIFGVKLRKSNCFANKMESKILLVVMFSVVMWSICPAICRMIDNPDMVVLSEEVAQCRASCLDQFLYDNEMFETPIDQCYEQTHCAMCWDFCQFLHKETRMTFKEVCKSWICVSQRNRYFAFDRGPQSFRDNNQKTINFNESKFLSFSLFISV